MKANPGLLTVLLLGVARAACVDAQGAKQAAAWGTAVDGIQLGLSASGSALRMQLRNRGRTPASCTDEALAHPDIEIDGTCQEYTESGNENPDSACNDGSVVGRRGSQLRLREGGHAGRARNLRRQEAVRPR